MKTIYSSRNFCLVYTTFQTRLIPLHRQHTNNTNAVLPKDYKSMLAGNTLNCVERRRKKVTAAAAAARAANEKSSDLCSTVTQRTDLQTLCWAHTHIHTNTLKAALNTRFALSFCIGDKAHTVAAKHIYFGFDFAFTYGKWTRTQYIHLTQDIMMQRNTHSLTHSHTSKCAVCMISI